MSQLPFSADEENSDSFLTPQVGLDVRRQPRPLPSAIDSCVNWDQNKVIEFIAKFNIYSLQFQTHEGLIWTEIGGSTKFYS